MALTGPPGGTQQDDNSMTTTITVSTAAELMDALASATGGETILLKAGNYGELFLHPSSAFGAGFDLPVTLIAADPQDPPVFSGLDIRNAANLAFDTITFDYDASDGASISAKPFKVWGCENVAIRNSVFDGDLASGAGENNDGYPTGFALNVADSAGIVIENNEVFNFYRGLAIGNSDDVVVRKNDLHHLRMDGMNFGSVQNVQIRGNYIHDFTRSPNPGDHADMIQFWTNGGTRPSTDIVIRRNVLDVGGGDATQSIFMRNDMVDRGLAGEEMYYRNVSITNNLIVNGHTNGLIVGATIGLEISGNSVLHADGAFPDGGDASNRIPRIAVSPLSTDVTIAQNATSSIGGYSGQADWTVESNALVQDQNAFAPGWYGDVFIASSLDPRANGEHRYIVKPGGLLDTLLAGSPLSYGSSATRSLDAEFHVDTTAEGMRRHFDASLTLGPQPEGTIYLWDFGDGTTASGLTVDHLYTKAGFYDVVLTVRTPDNRSSSETLKLGVDGPHLLTLDSSGVFALHRFGQVTLLDPSASRSPSLADSGSGLQLGAPGVSAAVERDFLAPMLNARDVTIALRLDADAAGNRGEVMRLQGSFVFSVESDGAAVLRAWSSEGEYVTLSAVDAKLNDTAPHDVEILLDGGKLQLWVDGILKSQTDFSGTFANTTTNKLAFGNATGAENFSGSLTAFEILVYDGKGSNSSLVADMDLRKVSADLPDVPTVPDNDAGNHWHETRNSDGETGVFLDYFGSYHYRSMMDSPLF
jgi:hypothetical protein